MRTSSWIDMAIPALYLVLSLLVGFWPSRRQDSRSQEDVADSYFLAGRSANCGVVAISLLSGMTSGIGMIGFPGDAYAGGVGLLASAVGYMLGGVVVAVLIAPVFAGLKLTTAYTYIELRFSRRLRLLMSMAFLLRIATYLALVLVAPADLLETMFDVPSWASVIVLGVLGTSYTIHGGMTSVIVTDFMQSITLVLGLWAVVGYALYGTQGEISAADWRASPSQILTPNIFEASVWWYILGGTFNFAAQMGTDQIAIQRLMSTPSVRDVQKSALATGCVQIFGVGPQVLAGVAIHAYYRSRGVDLVEPHLYDGEVTSTTSDGILPYFLVHETHAGIPGLVAGAVLGCTLSVYAGGLNASAACVVIDFLQLSDASQGSSSAENDRARILRRSKAATLAMGVVSILLGLLAIVFDKGIIQVNNTAFGLTAGLIFGVFLLGMLSKTASRHAAWCAVASGLLACFAVGSLAIGCGSREGLCRFEINSWLTTPFISLVTSGMGYLSSLILGSSPASSTLHGRTAEPARERRPLTMSRQIMIIGEQPAAATAAGCASSTHMSGPRAETT